MAYLEIPEVAHEFAARLQFATTFEVMEFLARKQIKLSQCMAEEHAKILMIKRALAGPAKREDERTLDKIGRMRNADEGRIASNFHLSTGPASKSTGNLPKSETAPRTW